MKDSLKLILFIALASTSILAKANPVCDVGRDKAKSDLKKYLFENYAGNYAFIERHLASGMNDFDRICKIPGDEVSGKILMSLKDYYPNFSFIYRHYQSNRASYDRLMKD